jgi:hypothetical protein
MKMAKHAGRARALGAGPATAGHHEPGSVLLALTTAGPREPRAIVTTTLRPCERLHKVAALLNPVLVGAACHQAGSRVACAAL